MARAWRAPQPAGAGAGARCAVAVASIPLPFPLSPLVVQLCAMASAVWDRVVLCAGDAVAEGRV